MYEYLMPRRIFRAEFYAAPRPQATLAAKHEYLMPRRIFHAEFYAATRLQATQAAM